MKYNSSTVKQPIKTLLQKLHKTGKEVNLENWIFFALVNISIN